MAKKKKQQAPVVTPVSAEGTRHVRMSVLASKEFVMGVGALLSAPMPIKAAHQMLKIHDQVEKHRKHYDELRHNLINQYGERDSEGKVKMSEDKKTYIIKDRPAFDKQFQELLDLEVEVSTIPMTSVEGGIIPPTLLATLLTTILNG